MKILLKVLVDNVHGMGLWVILLLPVDLYPSGRSSLLGMRMNLYQAIYDHRQVHLSAVAIFNS